jgi:uncharacterized membrane protein
MQNISLISPPTIGSSLNFGWQQTKKYFLSLLLVIIILAVVSIPVNMNNNRINNPFSESATILLLISGAYSLLFLPVITYATDLIFLHTVRNQKVDFTNLLIGFKKKNYLNIVLANLLGSVLIILAFITLIIPGIIVGCRLSLISYLVMDKGLGPVEAIETSWKMTRGHFWTIFGLAIVSIFILLLGLIMLIVGVLPALSWIKASFASLYETLLNEGNTLREETRL